MSEGALRCEGCDYPYGPDDLTCGLCGRVLRRQEAAEEPEQPAEPPAPAAPVLRDGPLAGLAAGGSTPPVVITEGPERIFGMPRSWAYLAAGAVAAPIFGLTPMLNFMGWFFGALFHEMGHTVAAFTMGCPAFPAISLRGHAVAMHSAQMPILCLVVAAGLGYGGFVAWKEHRKVAIACGVALLLYPALAFTEAKEFIHLISGHGGEYVFATLFFWRSMTGGATDSGAERIAYSTLAWYLVSDNVAMCFGLMTSVNARRIYAVSGSFGARNDYDRLANDVVHCKLELVAGCMLVAALLTLPAAILLRRLLRAPDLD